MRKIKAKKGRWGKIIRTRREQDLTVNDKSRMIEARDRQKNRYECPSQKQNVNENEKEEGEVKLK